MSIWRGWGILALGVLLLCSLIIAYIAEMVTGNPHFFEQNRYLLTISMSVSGVACWFLGRHFEKRPARVVIDKQTGEELVLREEDSFFFIKLKWYVLVWPLFGIIFLFE